MKNKSKFNLGQLVLTTNVSMSSDNNSAFSVFVAKCLERHFTGDWGDLKQDDKDLNEQALLCPIDKLADVGSRIFSTYNVPKEIMGIDEEKIYIITEYDRTVTTILFSSEY